jgi:glutathione S-transferase
MNTLTLYSLPPSPYNIKVRLALKLKKIDFKMIEVGFDDRDQVIQQSGQPLTPVLVDGERTVYDSFGIMRYLDANWPEPRLYNKCKDRQREIQLWERYGYEFGNVLGLVLTQAISGEIDDAASAQAQALLDELPQKLEDALAEQDYLMGEKPNAADLSLAPFLKYVLAQPLDCPEGPLRFVAERLNLDAKYPRTWAWAERVLAIDAVPVG